MIRPATEADIPDIVGMGLTFLQSAPYSDKLTPNPTKMADFARRLIASDKAVWFVAEKKKQLVGMLALFLFEHPFSGELVANELCWWMDPAHRGTRDALKLLWSGEAWARGHNATLLQMIAPSDHVAQFYERAGFVRTEVHYQRRIAA